MADKEVASRRKTEGQAVDQFRARGLVEIDHHVAAEDDVERLGMMKRLYQVEAVELDHVADGRLHAIPAFPAVRTAQQVFPEAVRGEIAKCSGRISGAPGGFEGAGGNVVSQNMTAPGGRHSELLEHGESDGKRLLACRAAGAPNPDGARNLRQNGLTQKFKMSRLAKERGEIGSQGVEQGD